jgi:hypothetical protein
MNAKGEGRSQRLNFGWLWMDELDLVRETDLVWL